MSRAERQRPPRHESLALPDTVTKTPVTFKIYPELPYTLLAVHTKYENNFVLKQQWIGDQVM